MRQANFNDVVNHIISEAVVNTTNGSWCVYFEEIEVEFETKLTKEARDKILSLLKDRVEVAEVEINENCFDMVLWLHYCGIDEED